MGLEHPSSWVNRPTGVYTPLDIAPKVLQRPTAREHPGKTHYRNWLIAPFLGVLGGALGLILHAATDCGGKLLQVPGRGRTRILPPRRAGCLGGPGIAGWPSPLELCPNRSGQRPGFRPSEKRR